MARLRSLVSLSSPLTLRSNTCGGGPSMDSKVMVGPEASVAIANAAEFEAAPPAAQPPSALAAARHNETTPARSSVRCGRAGVFDASLIVAFGDIAKTAQRLEREKHREGMKSLAAGRNIAIMLRKQQPVHVSSAIAWTCRP